MLLLETFSWPVAVKRRLEVREVEQVYNCGSWGEYARRRQQVLQEMSKGGAIQTGGLKAVLIVIVDSDSHGNCRAPKHNIVEEGSKVRNYSFSLHEQVFFLTNCM